MTGGLKYCLEKVRGLPWDGRQVRRDEEPHIFLREGDIMSDVNRMNEYGRMLEQALGDIRDAVIQGKPYDERYFTAIRDIYEDIDNDIGISEFEQTMSGRPMTDGEKEYYDSVRFFEENYYIDENGDLQERHPEEGLSEQNISFVNTDKANRVESEARLFTRENCSQLWVEHYPTGFALLDKVLGGGFRPGLHVIGAISSLGKSSMALQMADHMSHNGTPVIYASIEMSRRDITAKLVSMHTFLDKEGLEKHWYRTSEELVSREACQKMSDGEWGVVQRAASRASEIGRNISVIESQIEPLSADIISDYVDAYISVHDVKPVLFVDYLQILAAPRGVAMSDKQVIDYNIARFRSISAKHTIPIIIISSFNRDNYKSKAALEAFKSSGNIEYSSDSLMSLNLSGQGERGFDENRAYQEFPRKVELTILKQRYGLAHQTIPFNFYTAYSYFREDFPTYDEKSRRTSRDLIGKESYQAHMEMQKTIDSSIRSSK